MVGTSTLPPSTASSRVIGSSSRMSSPSRRKKRCRSTVTSPARRPPDRRRSPPALAAQPDRLPVGEALGIFTSSGAARQGDPPRRAPRRVEEADLERVVLVARRASESSSRASAPPRPLAEEVGEDIGKVAEILVAAPGVIGRLGAFGIFAVEAALRPLLARASISPGRSGARFSGSFSRSCAAEAALNRAARRGRPD